MNFKTTKNIKTNETNWMLLKKLMVNELFGTIKLNLGFMIQDSGISKVYQLVMSIRGTDEEAIKNTNKFDQIFWFLKELSEIKPDPSIVTLYLELYPEVDKQYFLSNLFRRTAFYIKQIPELHDVLELGSLSESVISQYIMKKYSNESYYSVEFEKFMNKYLPIIVHFVMNASSNLTSKNDSDIDIFSFYEFISSDKDHRVNIHPEKVFANRTNTFGRSTNKSNEKKGNEADAQLDSVDDFNRSALKTEKVDSETNSSEKSKILNDKSNEPLTVKRLKGEEMEDYNESGNSKISKVSKKVEKKRTLNNKEINEKTVPNTPIKDSKHSDSVKIDEIHRKKSESNLDQENSFTDSQETVSQKAYPHDDL